MRPGSSAPTGARSGGPLRRCGRVAVLGGRSTEPSPPSGVMAGLLAGAVVLLLVAGCAASAGQVITEPPATTLAPTTTSAPARAALVRGAAKPAAAPASSTVTTTSASTTSVPVTLAPVPTTIGPGVLPPSPYTMLPVHTNDARLLMVGDSVLLGAAPGATDRLTGWDVTTDAVIGRRVPEGAAVVASRADDVGDVIVILLGHNYSSSENYLAHLDAMMADLADVQRVIWVTVAEATPAQAQANGVIRSAPLRYRNVLVADWAMEVRAHPDHVKWDGVHLTSAGAVALADLIVRAVGGPPSAVQVTTTTSPTTTTTSPTTAPPTTGTTTSVPPTTAPPTTGTTG